MSSSETAAVAGTPASKSGLRRELHFWEAIALSIGIMAPTAAMALNGVAPAGLIGRAVPLAFIFATIGVLFVSYGFIRLSRYFSHAGSAFAFSGVTLGPQAGFFAGWGLLQRESWARILALVVGFLALLNVPLGTALGIYTLWVLLPGQSDQEYRALSHREAA